MDNNYDLLTLVKLQYPSLTKSQKYIADYLLSHYDKVVYLTAARFAQVVNVSESTVVRFACELGFSGYPEFQRTLEKVVKEKLTAFQKIEVSSDRILRDNKNLLKDVLYGDAERIHRTADEIDQNAFDASVKEIINADKVYILGGRSSAAIASFFAFFLNLMIEDVININTSTSSEVFEQIFKIREGDVCVAISFPRYSQRTFKALEYAKNQNATTISITDSREAPIAGLANHLLLCKSDMISFLESLAAPMSVINALLVAISVSKKDELLNAFEKLENLWNEYQVYASNNLNKYQAQKETINKEK